MTIPFLKQNTAGRIWILSLLTKNLALSTLILANFVSKCRSARPWQSNRNNRELILTSFTACSGGWTNGHSWSICTAICNGSGRHQMETRSPAVAGMTASALTAQMQTVSSASANFQAFLGASRWDFLTSLVWHVPHVDYHQRQTFCDSIQT